jgi:hypothetical protein
MFDVLDKLVQDRLRLEPIACCDSLVPLIAKTLLPLLVYGLDILLDPLPIRTNEQALVLKAFRTEGCHGRCTIGGERSGGFLGAL